MLFTHPKSALWQSPFYAGLRVVVRRSSQATGSKYMEILAEMQNMLRKEDMTRPVRRKIKDFMSGLQICKNGDN